MDSTGPKIFALDDKAKGAMKRINNIVVMTVSSKDDLVLKAEYKAGFVQGKLQDRTIASARDNSWDNAYLTDPNHAFPKKPRPSQEELQKAQAFLASNFSHFIAYVSDPGRSAGVAPCLKRLLFRMVGIYHGAKRDEPDYGGLNFSGDWLPGFSYFGKEELELSYESDKPTFLDIYFINAYNDLMDVISNSPEACVDGARVGDYPDFCSAFLKRQGNEIILTHNSWMGFLSQTMCQTLCVNGDMHTENAATPGLIGSGTDFGYNNKGIMYNETTHRFKRTKVDPNGLWIFWRSAMAEQFSGSIPEFFDMISIENTGTYLMGINFPASSQVRDDLQSSDNRPARREQFKALLPKVTDIEGAIKTITYTDPENPLSIFGRWDLGYGDTPFPKQIPDGSVDAKAATSGMVREFMKLSGALDINSPALGFQMLFGTPLVKGEPFIWSQSSWHWHKLRDVPDRLDGQFTQLPLFLR